MTYLYRNGKEIYVKDGNLIELEAHNGRKFGKNFMAHHHRKKGDKHAD